VNIVILIISPGGFFKFPTLYSSRSQRTCSDILPVLHLQKTSQTCTSSSRHEPTYRVWKFTRGRGM